MKKYRTYTAKKFKIWRKIIFFAVIAALIFAFSVILGNNLKKKLENADINTSEIQTTESKNQGSADGGEDNKGVEHDEALGKVRAGWLDLSGAETAKDAYRAVEGVAAKGFDAVSFNVTDGEGRLVYASPAVESASRLTASEELIPYDILQNAVLKAVGMDIRVSAVMTASDSLSDELVAAELSELGVDEIIVRGFEEHTALDNKTVSEINSYISALRSACGDDTSISVCFAPELFKLAKNAPYIEKIYLEAEFFAVDLTDLSADELSELVTQIGGSFSAYRLRAVLDGTDEESVSALDEVLAQAGISSRQYISGKSEENKSGSDGD